MKLVVGSYSILRRRYHHEKTVHLFNLTEDTNEEWDLRYPLYTPIIALWRHLVVKQK